MSQDLMNWLRFDISAYYVFLFVFLKALMLHHLHFNVVKLIGQKK